ncbi:lipid IV(A) 3-deoxy-D-manno-octulosonic acid transferase [Candidatus Schneideria nysicola]|uniref:lipid IV(A) 3-deoxy-D-manno-octulosonic acid transferase n=1 Tax=Candidatus Schneideria nysicola TaxID=1081631 RepID=UPI001CAA4566|nr:lipid IV(A) 3-deoxy-D-manno-octulosonic acid transferase [Candidatus Schneideria nysicola]UAJ65410.1 lipid IV(A) 3-deoxy-D-manno-octulosonic acid transferase [Candidatus Schneideria nysicola]UAJ65940.1 lipid IV(A) 3-deoxy-D-manno-octulosonic acid transferase [Candidatus Schneideria nysicola]
MMIIYNIILYLLQPLILIRLLWRSRKNLSFSYWNRLSERYGFCSGKVKSNGIMIHAVSVGETLMIISFIHALRNRYPTLPITITTSTLTASEQVQKKIHTEISHVYLPYDLPGSINRFLNQVNPKLVVIMETEIWPNLIKILHNRKIPIIIANARLSNRSIIGYKKIYKFIKSILHDITLIVAQDETHSKRFIEIGAKSNQLKVIGNLKFEVNLSSELKLNIENLRKKWISNRPIWIASSTHTGEERILLSAHSRLLNDFPDLLLILVPRHPERFLLVEKIVKQSHLQYILWSKNIIPLLDTKVLIGDTIGDLILLYGMADIAFIGGSMVQCGGHNPLEAVIHSLPILMGPYIENFEYICNSLQKEGVLIIVNNESMLVQHIKTLLINTNYRKKCGQIGFNFLLKHQGVTQRLLHILEKYIST